jgi:RNA polymerase sigma-70 factor (ECF subfamily)
VAERRRRFDPPARRRDELVRGFFAALDAGDVAGLEKLLAEDVVFLGDGGGRGPAVKEPVVGSLRVARFLAGLVKQGRRYGLSVEPAVVNGGPGAAVRDPQGRLLNVLGFDLRDGLVAEVRSQVNPDKLRHLGPVVSAAEVLQQGQRNA